MTIFRIATRDELWSNGRLLESRLSHGEAIEDELGILATDARDDALVALAERELSRLRDAMPRDTRVRLVAEASTGGVSATMTIRRGGTTFVTDAEHASEDDDLLVSSRAGTAGCAGWPSLMNAVLPSPALLRWMTPPVSLEAQSRDPLIGRDRPASAGDPSTSLGMTHGSILWKNGTAAVLLHEAFGHPAEHGQPPIEWPAWLHVDLGLRKRRATFRDVPLTRMSHVLVTQTNAPFAIPENALEVTHVDGGAYDPLTEIVTLQIGDFEYRATRQEVARSLAGATGEPIRYPGVICSREGQELVVPSFAPVMVTR